ncbi:transglycosylase SLT domain-containing protein [Rhizohabitans arisaemae]|uniref:aggregation-promoting factor C-terminal-like domain-containing protein n=1 Tax=Rhizohabitans arisaemae TaxID=2720610 RepID=UPI0024B21EAC|nr:transglycosylase SLT domain-containing protein [Rhizohabitans arisaemae]
MVINRALRNVSATVLATALVTVGTTGTAGNAADTASAGRSSGPVSRPVVHLGVWKTSFIPKTPKRPITVQGRNKAFASRLITRREWPTTQFRCLDRLWTRESNWNHRATNHSSGAYGIPQALPGWKMSGVGRDWRTNPETQIRWGLKYIKIRYRTPCGAWGSFQSRGWY